MCGPPGISIRAVGPPRQGALRRKAALGTHGERARNGPTVREFSWAFSLVYGGRAVEGELFAGVEGQPAYGPPLSAP